MTVGCFGHFDWLSFYLVYNPIVTINSTLKFVEKPRVFMSEQPQVPPFTGRPPLATKLIASYSIRNVKAGDVIQSTCLIDFTFSRAARAYSDRNKYSVNPLQWNCTVNQPVHCECFLFVFFCVITYVLRITSRLRLSAACVSRYKIGIERQGYI